MSTSASPFSHRHFPASRLETLGDGVFAIAMTVLVLGIQVPDVSGPGALTAHLITLWPKLASYALSFVMLGVLWIGHYYQFQYIRRADRGLIWLNLFFLLAVTFLPFGAGVLGNSYQDWVAVLLYGGTILAAGTALLLHWAHATARPELVISELTPVVEARLRGRIIAGLACSAVAMAIGAVDTRISLGVFLAMPFVYMRRTRAERELARAS
ncbi:MAG: hypothetical protein JWO36_595 [Myxococcales bacterium]|nr:hypothetical protein [Myxococcales bacterium]